MTSRTHRITRVVGAALLAMASGCDPVADTGLTSGSPRDREAEIEAIVLDHAGGRVGELRPLLEDRSPLVRIAAIWALGALGDQASKPQLLAFVEPDKRPMERVAAAHALVKLGESSQARVITTALEDSVAQARIEAAGALARPGDTAALPHVLSLVADKDAGVRAATAVALGRLRLGEALRALSALGKDPDLHVRAAAVTGLGLSRLPAAREHLVGLSVGLGPVEHLALAEAFGNIGTAECIPGLEELLRRSDGPARAAAVRSLAKIGSASARTLIENRLNDGDATVRAAAQQALDHLESKP